MTSSRAQAGGAYAQVAETAKIVRGAFAEHRGSKRAQLITSQLAPQRRERARGPPLGVAGESPSVKSPVGVSVLDSAAADATARHSRCRQYDLPGSASEIPGVRPALSFDKPREREQRSSETRLPSNATLGPSRSRHVLYDAEGEKLLQLAQGLSVSTADLGRDRGPIKRLPLPGGYGGNDLIQRVAAENPTMVKDCFARGHPSRSLL